jgi:hypothetical protein
MERARISGDQPMMRTIEVLIVIIIIAGAFVATSAFTVLPSPKQVSPINLNRLALTTLQQLDSRYDLSNAAFQTSNNTALNTLQTALSASLPPSIIYNLNIYNVNSGSDTNLYTSLASISNAGDLGSASDAASYLVASSNVTYNLTPEKIGANTGGGTLYILNCSDAPGWWITGYQANTLAQDLYTLLSPYFVKTVMVQSTTQLAQILDGTPLAGELLQNAVIINTCGEAVPMPTSYSTLNVGYQAGDGCYAKYDWTLGTRVNTYNWTWVSIVGWPFYYVSNTGLLSNIQNTWGIYGMNMTGSPGLTAFLQGLAGKPYSKTSSSTSDLTSIGTIPLSNQVSENCNYYGIYPAQYQTATRALDTAIISAYDLNVTTYVLNPTTDSGGHLWNPGAVYRHVVFNGGIKNFQGGFFALGLTRIPDIRLTALGLLCDYKPQLYGSGYTAADTSRLVVLQLGIVGGS